MSAMDGWHFASDTLRDGTPLPRMGQQLPFIADPIPCRRGYHASVRAIDALRYAPGSYVARVRLSGAMVEHGDPPDKICAEYRCNVTSYADCAIVLREFARMCALDVAHLWAMPSAVRQYLESGDEFLRGAAEAAARAAADAAWDAARDAARAAAWAAAWAAAAAAKDAARVAQNARLESMLYARLESILWDGLS